MFMSPEALDVGRVAPEPGVHGSRRGLLGAYNIRL